MAMALARPQPSLWQALLPGLYGPARPMVTAPLLQRLALPFRTPFAALAIPALSLPAIPSLGDIWNGILNAVPKKKTSHRKGRQRFMGGGKGLKDLTNLNTCSACGRLKRAHILCAYCVHNIRTKLFNAFTYEQRNPDGLTRKMRKQRVREDIAERKHARGYEPLVEKDKLGKQHRW